MKIPVSVRAVPRGRRLGAFRPITTSAGQGSYAVPLVASDAFPATHQTIERLPRGRPRRELMRRRPIRRRKRPRETGNPMKVENRNWFGIARASAGGSSPAGVAPAGNSAELTTRFARLACSSRLIDTRQSWTGWPDVADYLPFPHFPFYPPPDLSVRHFSVSRSPRPKLGLR